MEATLRTFGYPDSLVREYEHWLVLLRPNQITLGSLVLLEKGGANKFSSLSNAAFQEYGQVIKDVECVLQTLFGYDKINYLMLMMVDPEVHFHVIPRYAARQEFNSVEFLDTGWPGLPEMGDNNEISGEQIRHLVAHMKKGFKHHVDCSGNR